MQRKSISGGAGHALLYVQQETGANDLSACAIISPASRRRHRQQQRDRRLTQPSRHPDAIGRRGKVARHECRKFAPPTGREPGRLD
jgi:hypothetical protein